MKEIDKQNSEIYYLDDNNNIVDEEHSTHAIIKNTNENDDMINEIYLNEYNPNKSEKIFVTQEEYDRLKSLGDELDDSFVVKER